MTKAVRYTNYWCHCFIRSSLRENFTKNFVDIVWITILNCNRQSFFMLVDLQKEGNLFDNLFFMVDQEVRNLVLILIESNFSKFCEIDVQLDNTEQTLTFWHFTEYALINLELRNTLLWSNFLSKYLESFSKDCH